MSIPAGPVASGQSVVGKVSWFGGPNDHMAGNMTASGAPTSQPGIAVYNRATLGGYWRVTDPRTGRSVVLRQTDLGPAPWTGRKIDVTYSALGRFGYNESSFPTDSEFKATYLGRNLGARAAAPAGAATGSAPSRSLTIPARTNPAIEQVARMWSDEPLLRGLLETRAQTPAKTITLPGAPSASQAAAPRRTSGKLGGFLPPGAELQMERIDQGQDIRTNPGGPIIAPGDGEVIAVKSDPSGFGPDYPVVRFTSGKLAGTTWYLGHTHSDLRPGAKFRAGQALSRTGTHGVGNATVPGWAEIGLASALGSGNMQAGRATIPYLR